ncbi:ABC transporter ATP-binding protein [Pseudactinotalea terrae]|uniref:ABC transporter ATP-binding protein n=1 Tax=Pseudactinotalea terrae TaxID=1743262 RepID=UPI0013913D46|nr:ABC transporter ATP-binding protein [Pseudactinotalea terrae]
MSADQADDRLVAEDVYRSFKVTSKGRKAVLTAVNGVSLSISPSETVALVGESGSGKSTLGRMMLGLDQPTEGRVLYQGRDVNALDRAQWRDFRREVQVIFQDTGSSLNPRRSIGDSVEMPLLYNLGLDRREARARVADLLDTVGLPPDTFINRSPLELSGGQRQRVSIARAMASEPRFIVADEAVSALDVSVRAQVLKVMKEIQHSRQLSYLFITHDLGVVRAIADRVVVMYLGEIVESGPASIVLEQPSHPYTRSLLAAAPRPDPTMRTLARAQVKGEIPSPIEPPLGCRFHTRCPIARDVCATTVPAAVDFGDGSLAACHFADEVRSGAGPWTAEERSA